MDHLEDDDIEFGDESPPIPPKRGPGRPRKNRGVAQETVITKRLIDENDEDKEVLFSSFENLFDKGADGEHAIVKVRVVRKEPDEGFLGYIEDMEANIEQYLRNRWGGSLYRLEGVRGNGKLGAVRTLKISGDPVFESQQFEQQWRKRNNIRNPNVPENSLSPQELIAMLDEREAKRRDLEAKAEDERRQRQREWEAEQKAREREWEDKRRRDDEEREARRRRDFEESQARSQANTQMMLTMVMQQANQNIQFIKETLASKQQTADPSDMLLKGVTLALQLKEATGAGAEPDDLITTVVKNLPQMLTAAGNAVGKAVKEVKSGPPNDNVRPNPQLPRHNPPGGLVIPPGKAAEKLQAIVKKITENGGNPDEVLPEVFDRLLNPQLSATPEQQREKSVETPVEKEPDQQSSGVVKLQFRKS